MYKEQQNSYINSKAEFERSRRLAEAKKDRKNLKDHPVEEAFKKGIVGQLGPIYALSSAIRRKQNGWYDEDRPLTFMFCGPSGVGKTELAKALAEYIHGNSKEAFVRIDMSEYQHGHEVSRLIGSPPGYQSHADGGQLTEKLKKCPNAVVLLDEVEKAHPDVLTIMLQLFDEGRITDGKGTTVECKNAIFVMTSNLAQREIAEEAEFLRHEPSDDSESSAYSSDDGYYPDEANHFPITVTKSKIEEDKDIERKIAERQISLSRQFMQHTILPLLHTHFRRDEFLGRINEVLVFLPFSEEEIDQLIYKELIKWADKAYSRHGITMTWDRKVIEVLSSGYSTRYGARSIKYEVERKIVDLIARATENDEISSDGVVHFVVKESSDKTGLTRRLEIQESGGMIV